MAAYFDVVNAYALIAKKTSFKKNNFNTWNVGPTNENKFSVRDIIEMVKKRLDKKIKIKVIKYLKKKIFTSLKKYIINLRLKIK